MFQGFAVNPARHRPQPLNRHLLHRLARLALSAAVAIIAASIHVPSATAKSSLPPNIVLIMTDDQGYGDLSLHGNEVLKTPTLDRLAKQSVQFDRFFVCPVCAPTRASLLTGRYHLRGGVWGVTKGRETLDLDAVTMGEIFKKAGYATGLFGKWHLGEHFPNVPHGQGFDEFVGFRTGHWNAYFDSPLEKNGKPYKSKGYISDVFTDHAIEFMTKNQSKPFLCYVAYNAPHAPFQVPDEEFQQYENKGLKGYTNSVYAMVANLDKNINRLLKTLDELKIEKNTIVIFLTDNGPNGPRYNADMRGRKGSLYEGGVRVPCFVRWPGHLKPSTIKQTAHAIDLLPTLMELCQVNPKDRPSFDGKSLAPLLKNPQLPWADRLLFFHRARTAKKDSVNRYPGAVRTQQYRLYLSGKKPQLYDLQNDPSEKTNIAKDKPGKVKELKAAYEKWFDGATDRKFVSPMIPVGHDEENPVALEATRAWFDGKIRFKGGQGWAHDWLTNWSKPEDRLGWKVDVAQAGTYELTLHYLCLPGNEGGTIVAKVGDQTISKKVENAHWPKPVSLPDRYPRWEVPVMRWASLPLGKMTLPKGEVTITLMGSDKKGEGFVDVKDLTLERLDD